MIPTAEEFFYNRPSGQAPEECLIDFAKLHVEAALKDAAEKANLLGYNIYVPTAPDDCQDSVTVCDPNGPDYCYRVNKDSILSAYPLDNIK